MSPKAAIQTLGCRLNHAESASIAEGLRRRGYEIVPDGETADLIVLNSCSVTEGAEAKCRQAVRGAAALSPEAFVVVTGCYAEIGADSLAKIPGIDLIVGSAEKMEIPNLLPAVPCKGAAPTIRRKRIPRGDFVMEVHATYDQATRPNVKIQDGCDFFCSFCVIPYTRGRERSRLFDDILAEARGLARAGHREIVLSGVNLGRYLSQGRDLSDLIDALEKVDGLSRIRLSSIEPTTVPERLLERMAGGGKICPYLHLPLQSGSDRVLDLMGRRYTIADYRKFVLEAVRTTPDLCLGTDLIVGFPSEGEDDFAATLKAAVDLPFAYFHVFPYSRRKGTRADRTPAGPPVPSKKIRERVRVLSELSAAKRKAFYERFVGREVEVLCETKIESGYLTGFTSNYLKVGLPAGTARPNELRRARIERISLSPLFAAGVPVLAGEGTPLPRTLSP